MRRLCAVLLSLLLLNLLLAPLNAQEGPEGVWLGTWPYTALSDHHLNAYATNGLRTNLGSIYREFVELAPAYYVWIEDTYWSLLAEAWGFVDDNSAYQLKLREDALWSNGAQVDADDVITTYALGRLVRWSQFRFVDEVEKVDEFTVKFHLSNAPSLQLERLILREPIVADDTYGELATRALELFATGAENDSEEWQSLLEELQEFRPQELIASGPYTYSLDDVGEAYLSLHWQPDSIFSDMVRFHEIRLWAGETEATAPLVLSGELAHSTNLYPPSTIESFQSAGIYIVTIPRGYGPALLFNLARAPWNIKEVRQAVALVIDRDQSAFLTNGFGASGTEYMSGVLDTSARTMLSSQVLDSLERYKFNPARAAELLQSVGFWRNDAGRWLDANGNSIRAEYIFPQEFADFSGAAQDAVQQMNAFGFEITSRALPWQQVPEQIRAGTFDLSVWSWGAASPFAGQHFNNPLIQWDAALAPDQPGLSVPYDLTFRGESYNLETLISNINSGLETGQHRERAGLVARILNEEMFYVPLSVLLSTEPFNTEYIDGLPAPDDPLLQNPTGTDHFIKWYILNGQIGPTQAAINVE